MCGRFTLSIDAEREARHPDRDVAGGRPGPAVQRGADAAPPHRADAPGGPPATIVTATVTDTSGNPVSGTLVRFSEGIAGAAIDANSKTTTASTITLRETLIVPSPST